MTVLPSDFATEMERLWKGKLGNVASPAFRELWTRMGETFHDAITQNMKANELTIGPAWHVLAPEMGVGKTQGALLFLAMMAKTCRLLPPPVQIGGMFVARTILQCEEAVKAINELAGFNAAIARHSDNSVTLDACRYYPVVVVTHAAVTQSWALSRSGIFETYGRWSGGRRCLFVIDEALANAIEFHSIDEASLHRVLALRIPPDLRAKHKAALEAVSDLLDFIRVASGRVDDTTPLWSEQEAPLAETGAVLQAQFDDLLSDLRTAAISDPIWNDPDSKKAELLRIAETLSTIVQLQRHWALFSKQGDEKKLITAMARLPQFFAPVLLNATADHDPVLDYRRARIVPLPKVRNYQNLTINILRSNGIGKQAMSKAGEKRFLRLGEFIAANSEPGDKWMVVTHLATEALARKHLPDEIALTGHWGNLDGRNDFRDCNKAVLFGLSFRDQVWPTTMYFALRGMRPKEWLRSDEAKAIRHNLEVKSIAAQVIQAIGRTRSRKVIDEDGNCLPTEAYVTLPKNVRGKDIEEAVRGAFIGATIRNWDFDLDGRGGRSMENASPGGAVVVAMSNKRAGRYLISDIAKELALTSVEAENLKDALRKKRTIFDELARVGVYYVVEGSGRGRKSYLVKR